MLYVCLYMFKKFKILKMIKMFILFVLNKNIGFIVFIFYFCV